MNVKIYITEVVRDTNYAGTIDFGGQLFAYTLEFGIPMSRLDAYMEDRVNISAKECQELFPIVLHDVDEKVIDISPEEYFYLFCMIGGLAVNLHNDPQAVASKDPNGQLMKKLAELKAAVRSISVSLETTVTCSDESVPEKFRAVRTA
jgi:hypothetical protein